jgi:hypothetical protein
MHIAQPVRCIVGEVICSVQTAKLSFATWSAQHDSPELPWRESSEGASLAIPGAPSLMWGNQSPAEHALHLVMSTLWDCNFISRRA